jgi:hypothetical protein
VPYPRRAPWLWLAVCAPALCGFGAETPPAATHIEHIRGSNFTHVHTLPLKDAEGGVIKPENELGLGFSTKGTCGKCHVYPRISAGWHFNAIVPGVPPGRPGQPWFIANEKAATVLPVTYRSWPNTWDPADLGMKPWKYVQTFGHHLPGGGPGEKTEVEDPQARWFSSGPLEVNCFACHSGAPSYDHVQYHPQIARQNYLWAPAATLTELATVQGEVAKMPEGYDPSMGPSNDQEAKDAPKAVYNLTRFNPKKETFFDIPRRPLNQRCYFCHSSRNVGNDAPEIWNMDEDVHLRAGMLCAECHRNDEGHMIRRGYEQEPGAEDPRLWTLTCRGCHLDNPAAAGGRLGAPVPKHKGFPPIHFAKLTCTACHSGPYPGPTTAHLQTSQSHFPEILRPGGKRDTLAPIIVEPVFARRDYDGKIGPQRMVWPAFWGRLAKDGKVKPLDPDAVLKAAPDVFKSAAEKSRGKLSEENVIAVLKVLGAQAAAEGEPVYISGGRMYRSTQEYGPKLEASQNPAAEPVAWPLAHNVRPANQALGVRGCVECHGQGAPFFFGEVEVPALVSLGGPATLPMYSFLGEEREELEAWALSYRFRPLFKVIGFSAAIILAGVLAFYGLLALRAVSACFSRKAASETEGKKA